MSEVPLYSRSSHRRAAELACVGHGEQLLHRNVQRFRGGLVFKAHRLCVSLNSRLESNKEEEEEEEGTWRRCMYVQGYLVHKKMSPPTLLK